MRLISYYDSYSHDCERRRGGRVQFHENDTGISKIISEFKSNIVKFPERTDDIIKELPDESEILKGVLTHGGCSASSCVYCRKVTYDVEEKILETKMNIPERLLLKLLCIHKKKDKVFELLQHITTISSTVFTIMNNNGWEEHMELYDGNITTNYWNTYEVLKSCGSAKLMEYYILHTPPYTVNLNNISSPICTLNVSPILQNNHILRYASDYGFKHLGIMAVLLEYLPWLDDYITFEDNDYESVKELMSFSDIQFNRKIYYSNATIRRVLLCNDWTHIQYFPEEYKTDDILMVCVKRILNLPIFE